MRVAIRLAGNPPTVWSVRSEAERRNYGKSLLGEAIVTNAKHLANSLMGRSVEVIQNGIVDTKAADVVVPLHHELGLEPNARFIAAVGDLTKKKRWKDLVWAFDLLRVIHPNVHLLLLGNGIESRNVQAFASSAACASGVHMLGHRTDVTSILRQSFCFWQASEDEGCSNAMLEAMAAGLPVIASGIAGHRESLCEGKFGTFVPLGDCAEMARRTNVIMAGPSEANERSTEAREYALQHYSVDKMIGKYRSTYDALLARRAVAA